VGQPPIHHGAPLSLAQLAGPVDCPAVAAAGGPKTVREGRPHGAGIPEPSWLSLRGIRQVQLHAIRVPRRYAAAEEVGILCPDRAVQRRRDGQDRPPVSRGISSSLQEGLRRSLPRHRIPQLQRAIPGARYAFFKAWRNLSGPMGVSKTKNQIKTNPWVGTYRLPLVGPGPRAKNAPGGSRSFSSSADEFRPAGWSPPEPVSASPARTAYHALPTRQLKTGTFYFAGKRNFLLCLDSDRQRRTPPGACSPTHAPAIAPRTPRRPDFYDNEERPAGQASSPGHG
jgi:hypothetical protein